jgi:hypothetical protein
VIFAKIMLYIKTIVADNRLFSGGLNSKIGFAHQFWTNAGGVMRELVWSRNTTGTLNGKVGFITLFSIAYYPERGYFLAPKLPGLNKTIPISSVEEGKSEANKIFRKYVNFLLGAEW